MARIEQNGPINPSISSRVDVFTPNVNQAGATAEANQQLGMNIANVGMAIADKVKKTEDNDYAFNSTIADHKAVNDFSSNDILNNGADGHSDRVKEFIAKTQDDRAANAPSNEANKLYNQKTAGMFTEFGIRAQQTQIQEMAKKSREGLQDQADISARSLLQVPSSKTFFDAQKLFHDRVDSSVQGGTVAIDDAEKLKKQYNEFSSKSLFDGYLDFKGDKGLDEGYRQLSNPELVKNLRPEDLDRLQDSFRARMKQRNELQFGDAKNYIKDAIAQAKNGEQPDSNGVARAFGVLSQNKKVSPDEFKRIDQELKGATVIGDTMNNIVNLPRSEWSNQIKESSDKIDAMAGKDQTFGARERMDLKNSLISSVKKMSDEQAKDPTGFGLKYNASLRDLATRREASPQDNQMFLAQNQKFQEFSQLPQEKRQIDSKAQADRWATAFRSVNTAPQMGMVIDEIQKRYGPYSQPFMEQMSKDHKDLAGLAVASHFEDRGTREAIAENVIKQKEIAKAFKEVPSSAQKDIKSEVALQTRDYVRAITAGNTDKVSLSFANSLVDQVTLESQKNMTNNTDNASAKDVVNRATEKIINKQFDVVKGGRSFVFINKNAYGNASKEDVSGFLSQVADRSAFKELDVQPFPEFLKKYSNDKEDQGHAQNNFYDYLKDTHRWVRNDYADGVYLVSDDGVHAPTAITNKKGELVEVKFRDMGEKVNSIKSNRSGDFFKANSNPKDRGGKFFGGF